jgi:Domain of unknown function (DUF4252)
MRYILILLVAFLSTSAQAQSKTTESLQKKYSESLALFFYNNTLRMVNLTEDKEFDELIKDIEKMKFLMIKKNGFEKADYKKLISDYKAEAYEEMMTSRHDGKNFDVYMRDGKSKGMIVTVNDDENLYVLDIVGSFPLNKVTKLFSTIDSSSEIGKRIKDFASNDDKDEAH